jgi:hypothetical protein
MSLRFITARQGHCFRRFSDPATGKACQIYELSPSAPRLVCRVPAIEGRRPRLNTIRNLNASVIASGPLDDRFHETGSHGTCG